MRPAAEVVKRWLCDPRIAARELFGETPDPWQDDVLAAFSILNPDPRAKQIAMKACKNPGKTWLLAVLCWIFLSTRPFSEIAAISITAKNLKTNLWKEMSRLHAKSRLLQQQFKVLAESIYAYEAPMHWFMSAKAFEKKSDKNEQSAALSGTHSDQVMFVLDESGEIPPAVLVTAEAGMGSGKECRIVLAGNPTTRKGALFHASVTNAKYYLCINITGDPDSPRRAPRVKLDWAKRMIELYSRDSPWVKANVLGEFPESDINTLISPEQVEEAMRREIPESSYNWCQKRLGIDVAFQGDDLTVLAPRQGMMWFDPIPMRVTLTRRDFCAQIAARALLVKKNWKYDRAYVDAQGGYGQGVIEQLMAEGQDPLPVLGAEKATDPMFANKVSENYFNMIQAIKDGASLPHVPEMIAELSERTYSSVRGRFMIQPKDLFKEDLGRSPDFSDAFSTTFATPDEPAEDEVERYLKSRRQGGAKTNTTWHPFAKKKS